MTAYHSISQAVREMSLRRTTMRRRCWVAAIMAGAVFWVGPISAALATAEVDRSPVDLALSPDEAWLITVNQTSDSVSLVDVAEGKVVGELSCGHHPSAVALAADGRVVVTGTYSCTLDLFELSDGRLTADGSIAVGSHPVGVAISADGRTAYVALEAAAAVAVVDLQRKQVVERISVGRWPRYLALSPDGSRLAVGTSGDQSVSVVDTASSAMLYQERVQGLNLGHLAA